MSLNERRGREASGPATDAAALLLRLGVVALAILIPCASVISRRPLFILTPIGMVLVILGSRLSPERRMRTLPRLAQAVASPLGLATLLFLGWAGLSFLWTPFPALALDRFGKTAGTLLLALVALGGLPKHVRVSNSNLLPIGVAAAGLAIVAVAIFAPAAVQASEIDTNTVHRAMIGVVVLAWPALGALAMRERMGVAGSVAGIVAIAAVAVWLPSALAALILAILAFSFAHSNPERTGALLGCVAATLILAAPAIPLVVKGVFGGLIDPNGSFGGFPAWADIVRGDGLHLITGHGFDSSVRAYLSGRLPEMAPRGLLFELWFELGVVGAATAATLAFLCFTIAGRASRVIAPFLLAELVCVIALGASGQAISQLWWLTLVSISALCFAIVMRGEHRAERVRARVVSGATA